MVVNTACDDEKQASKQLEDRADKALRGGSAQLAVRWCQFPAEYERRPSVGFSPAY